MGEDLEVRKDVKEANPIVEVVTAHPSVLDPLDPDHLVLRRDVAPTQHLRASQQSRRHRPRRHARHHHYCYVHGPCLGLCHAHLTTATHQLVRLSHRGAVRPDDPVRRRGRIVPGHTLLADQRGAGVERASPVEVAFVCAEDL